jgi:undecaprenyl pyrophosphate synthase
LPKHLAIIMDGNGWAKQQGSQGFRTWKRNKIC